ncbi:enoyl-CoA hydratase/isomerase family protein [Streptomyces iconiensis]|uniref:3-hydroxyisobutyryl-CoA hydrolase n=1 Tax=Streptomyces iconiensis TaxID=1384038 RepID=A0ABT6ZQX0_9ACTN|nr:enoyl-CoA hydratase/isomerase family protein [Streptomyces iconiensis]MDJ1131451.1 enoyl-CoA hydratase/isomerase family protein [Streptomyces iconiensis]
MTGHSPAPAGPDEPVLVRREGRAGHLRLNRPRALNALNHAMVRALATALASWEQDDEVATVVLTGAGERGLCAGGDIRGIHEDVTGGGGAASAAFWRDEYRLNARIARFPKPYVAVMDGVVMGGGVGVSAHGDVRVVTERSRVAMPETGIGFVPDVGGTWLLSRAPGELGTHLALTASPVGAGDALLCGLADHFVPADLLDSFVGSLAEREAEEAVRRYAEPAPGGKLEGQRGWIDACYAADSVEEILRRLRDHGSREAKEAAVTIETRSPTALKVTLESLRRARRLDSLESTLEQEFRVSAATLSSPDFAEGVRAQIIDKDRTPRWSPASLPEVSATDVERHFAPAPAELSGQT